MRLIGAERDRHVDAALGGEEVLFPQLAPCHRDVRVGVARIDREQFFGKRQCAVAPPEDVHTGVGEKHSCIVALDQVNIGRLESRIDIDRTLQMVDDRHDIVVCAGVEEKSLCPQVMLVRAV